MISVALPRCLLFASLLIGTAPGLATADQITENYVPVTRLNLTRAPTDPCVDACFDAAQQERNRQGPEPAAPLFRLSATQAATGRETFVKMFSAQANLPLDMVEGLEPNWDGAIAEWRKEDPRGEFNPKDLADILAKYWLFAWMYGAGFDPDKLTEAQRSAVRIQVHHLFVTDPVLALLTEAQRQGLAETVIRQQYSEILLLSTSGGKNLEAIMDGIAAHFEGLFDLDLQKLGLTADQGFVLMTSQ